MRALAVNRQPNSKRSVLRAQGFAFTDVKSHERECTVWKTRAIPACTLQDLPGDIFRTVARPTLGCVKFHNANWLVVLARKHVRDHRLYVRLRFVGFAIRTSEATEVIQH